MRSVPCDQASRSVRRVMDRSDVDGIAVLRLAHGPVNAMDAELCDALADQARGLAAGPERAIVLTGAGKAFSAGADLKRIAEGGEEYARRYFAALDGVFRAWFAVGKPVVAAVNGHAIAGGCILAACADVVLMAEGRGRIGLPELQVGVPFPRSATEAVRFTAGDVVTRRLVLGSRTHSPAEAVALGLVDEVVPADELEPTAVARARALADTVPPDTFALAKAHLRRDHTERIAAAAEEDAAAAELWVRRAEDGWIANYLTAVTGRR